MSMDFGGSGNVFLFSDPSPLIKVNLFRSEHTTALFGIGVPQSIRDGTLDFFIHVCCEWIPLSRRMGFN